VGQVGAAPPAGEIVRRLAAEHEAQRGRLADG